MGLIEMFVVTLVSLGVLEDVVVPVAETTWETVQEVVNADEKKV